MKNMGKRKLWKESRKLCYIMVFVVAAILLISPPVFAQQPNFWLVVNPPDACLQQLNTMYRIAIQVQGAAPSVSLSVSAPRGISVELDRRLGRPPFTSSMTISVSEGVAEGDYSILIRGTSGEVIRSTIFRLRVTAAREFSIIVEQPEVEQPERARASVQPGGIISGRVLVGAGPWIVPWRDDNVILSYSAPPGIRVSFDPTAETPAFTSSMGIAVDRNVAQGIYTVIITGTDERFRNTRSATIILGVGVTLPNTSDFGDAPDPYPSPLAINGARHADITRSWLGERVDAEVDSNQIDQFDDGLINVNPISFRVANNNWNGTLYFNVLIDLNGNGDWDDAGEWVVRNMRIIVPVGQSRIFSALSPFSRLPESTWMRMTLTDVPLSNYIGTGQFVLGETEDYYLTPTYTNELILEQIKRFVEEEYNPAIESGEVPDWIKSFFGNERMNWYITRGDGSILIIGTVSTDGKFIEIKQEEIFNPTVKLHVTEGTLANIIFSDDPASAFQVALKYGDIKVEGVGAVNTAKYFATDVLGKIATRFIKSPYDVKQGEEKEIVYMGEMATLKLNSKNVRVVEFPDKEEVVVVDKYGSRIGYSTKNIQKLVSQEHSPPAGIYELVDIELRELLSSQPRVEETLKGAKHLMQKGVEIDPPSLMSVGENVVLIFDGRLPRKD